MRTLALSLCVAFLLTACQTTENVGSGPISDMPESAINGYRNYLRTKAENTHLNSVFAYNKEAGGFGWSARLAKKGMSFAVEQAVENCWNSNSYGSCDIFDIDVRIVWKDLNEDLKAELLEPLAVKTDALTYEYDANVYRITTSQLQKFESKANIRKDFTFTAFFVSADGKSYGVSYVTSTNTTGHEASIVNARKDCQIASSDEKCYLFATNGEPVNEDARRATGK